MRKLQLQLIVLAFSAFALAAAPPSMLPPSFSGWQRAGAPQASKDARQADPANAALLKEYGFTDFESAAYTRDGRSLQVKAARFADATGAYGAFTFYNLPQMQTEQIGDQAVSNVDRVIFRRGNILVTAGFLEGTAMSLSEFRFFPAKTLPARA